MNQSSVSIAARVEFWLVVAGLLLGSGEPGLASENAAGPGKRIDSNAPTTGGEAAYEQIVKNSAPNFGNDELNGKMLRLWSDVPDYVLRLQRKENFIKEPAQLVSSVVPVYPPVLLPSDGKATVLVSLVVDEKGGVEAERMLETTDGRFTQAALDAVRQWRFTPALSADGPTKMFLCVPCVFQGTNWAANPIDLALQPVGEVVNMRAGIRHPVLRFEIRGAAAAEIKAARLVVTRAEDDTGTALRQETVPKYYYPAVGSTSRADFTGAKNPSLEARLTPAAPAATKIRTLEATAELIIPVLDPDATAVIENLAAKAGTTVVSAPLHNAGITLELFDQRAYDARLATYHDQQGGLTDYGIGVYLDPALFDKNVPHEQIQKFIDQLRSQDRPLKVTDRDIAIGITDPENRLVAWEFRTADGATLVYNRNGWAHIEHRGKYLDFYRFEAGIPSRLQLVCWLLTPKSLVPIPLKLADLPLPEKPTRQPITPSAPEHDSHSLRTQ